MRSRLSVCVCIDVKTTKFKVWADNQPQGDAIRTRDVQGSKISRNKALAIYHFQCIRWNTGWPKR